MCKSKVYRLSCLLLVFLLFFQSYGLSVSAASDNLIDSDFRNWDYLDEHTLHHYPDVEGDIYYFSCKAESLNDAGYVVKAAYFYDLADLVAGHSYTFSFHLCDFSELYTKVNPLITENNVIYNIVNNGAYYIIGLASYNSTGDYLDVVPDCFIKIDSSNYLNYFGKNSKITFELPNMVNPCITISYCEVSKNNYAQWTGLKGLKLIDNDSVDEESFFDNLFQFFHDLKWEIVGGSCGDSECYKSPHKSLAEKITSNFQESLDNLKQFFHDLKWDVTGGTCDKPDCPKKEHTSLAGRINSHVDSFKESFQDKIDKLKQSVIELKDGIINGIKSLFVPDEDVISTLKTDLDILLEDHLGIIYTCGNLVKDFLQNAFNIIFEAPDSFEIVIPDVSFEAGGTTVQVFTSQNIDFSFMEKPVFQTLYSMYKVALYIFFGGLEVKYALRTYRKVMSN